MGFCHGFATVGTIFGPIWAAEKVSEVRKWFKIKEA
jgi:hypothetical protein